MRIDINDYYKYDKTMWTSYPLLNDVVINGNKVESSDIVISAGNSGGPLYYKDVIIQNGLIKVVANILGVALRYRIFNGSITSFFRKNNPLFVNVITLLMDS